MRVREYTNNDLEFIQNALVKLNDYIAKTDPSKRIYTAENFRIAYTENVLNLVDKQHGILYICETENVPVGFIAGVIEEFSSLDMLSYNGTVEGRIIEFFLEEDYRGSGAAQALIQKLEDYFKQLGCDFIRVIVFNYNEVAKKFYTKCGYKTRIIEMCKSI